jgi:enoyl-CoA hydratase/carnithine racemase
MTKAFDFFEREPTRPSQSNTLRSSSDTFNSLGLRPHWQRPSFLRRPRSSQFVLLLALHPSDGCAGLLESKRTGDGETALFREMRTLHHPNGFGGMSLRRFSKPIIAAAQGGAYGGGCEILLNVGSVSQRRTRLSLWQCDMVIAGESVKIALPEPKRGLLLSKAPIQSDVNIMAGVAALAGGIPRLFHIAGHQLAAEVMFTGRVITAQEARDRFKFVNYVVRASACALATCTAKTAATADKDVLTVALDWAKQMVACSPDAVQVTKEAMNFAQYDMLNSTEVACTTARSVQGQALMSGENCKEGLVAFEEVQAVLGRRVEAYIASTETRDTLEGSAFAVPSIQAVNRSRM